MVERGVTLPYLEHWHRVSEVDASMATAVAREPGSGTLAIALRVADHFAVARGRHPAMSVVLSTIDFADQRVALAAEQIRALVDCEISFGVVTPAGWRITASNLPFLEGRLSNWRIHREQIDLPAATPTAEMLTWPIEEASGALELFDFNTSPTTPEKI